MNTNSKSNKTPPKPQQQKRVATGGGARGARNAAQVAQAISNARDQLDGEFDAVREMLSEVKEQIREETPRAAATESQKPLGECLSTDFDTPPPQVRAPDFVEEKVKAENSVAGYARLHFSVLGYSDKSLSAAFSKATLWMARNKEWDITDSNAKRTLRQVWDVYADRWSVSTWWERLKLRVYDWVCNNSIKVAVTAAVSAAVGVAIGYRSRSVRTTLSVVTSTAAVATMYYRIFAKPKRQSSIHTYSCPQLLDHCTGTDVLPPQEELHASAKVIINPVTCCNPVAFQVGFTINPGMVWIPRLCGHNELNALTTRQLLPALGTEESRKILWTQGVKALLRDLPPIELTTNYTPVEMFEVFAAKYPLHRRKTLRATFLTLDGKNRYPECMTKAFVKREWLVGKALNKRNPRLISGKTEDYLCETGPEYYCWMKMMCKHYWPNMDTVLHRRYIYTGGMTADEIGLVFTYFVRNLGWEVVEGDYSRYDGHNELEALDAEMQYYSDVMTEDTTRALRRQLVTEGRTSSGHKFQCYGKVASGVINTSFGNTLRGFMVVAAYADEIKLDDFAVMQLGDDNIIFVKDIVRFNLPQFTDFCEAMGHKLEAVHRPDPDFAEYCSQRFWDVGDRYVLGPKPARVLAKTFITHDPTLTPADMPEYCRQVAVGMLNFDWIPVLGPFVKKWAATRPTNNKRVQAAVARSTTGQFHKITLREPISVELAAIRAQFFKIYKFDPTDLEQALCDLELQTGVAYWDSSLDHMCEEDGVGTQDLNFIEQVEISAKHLAHKYNRNMYFV